MNSVCLIGNLTRDPELRATQSGTSVCKLGIAVNDRKPDGNGGWGDYAHFFNIVVWGKQAETCAQYLAKGKKIAVKGKLEWRQWEADDGTRRTAIEIVADPFGIDFLTPRDGDGTPATGAAQAGGAQPAADFGGWGDDDIPF